MSLNDYKEIPKSKYFGIYDTEEDFNNDIDNRKEELKEAYYAIITNNDDNKPDLYQYSKRTTNNDDKILAKYNKNDNHKELKFIESVWGYVGWTWENYNYNEQILKGGHFTNFKPTYIIESVEDGYRLQHINDFIKNLPNITELKYFDNTNIITANNAFDRSKSIDVAKKIIKTDNFICDWPNLIEGKSMFKDFNIDIKEINNLNNFTAINLINGEKLVSKSSNIYNSSTVLLQYKPFNKYDIPNIENSNDFFYYTIISNLNDDISKINEDNTEVNIDISYLFINKFNKITSIKGMFHRCNIIGINNNKSDYLFNLIIDVDKMFNKLDGVIELYQCAYPYYYYYHYAGIYYNSKSIKIKNLIIKSTINKISIDGILGCDVSKLIIDDNTKNNIESCKKINSSNKIYLDDVFFNEKRNNDTNLYYNIIFTENVPSEKRYFNFSPDDTIQEIADEFSNCTVNNDFEFINLDKCKNVDLSYFKFTDTTTDFNFQLMVPIEGVNDEDRTISLKYARFNKFKYSFNIICNNIDYTNNVTNHLYVNDLSNITINMSSNSLINNTTYLCSYGEFTKSPIINLNFTSSNSKNIKLFYRSNNIEDINVNINKDDNIKITLNCENAEKLHNINIIGNIEYIYLNYCKNLNIKTLSNFLLSQTSNNNNNRTLTIWENCYNSLSTEVQNYAKSIFTITLINN